MEAGFRERAEAADCLAFRIVERIESLLLTNQASDELAHLRRYAQAVKERLESVDQRLFRKLRADIASGRCRGADLRRRILEYDGRESDRATQPDENYDNLDALTNGLLLVEDAPREIWGREPEMVFYQPTPARIVLELVDEAGFRQDDVFYDIGSGLGQVAIWVHLLGGVRTRGIEIEPAYCDYARRCARALNLSGVEFTNVDARVADYTDGTIFFMYTPFEGKMLADVLERFRDESRERGIRLFTYGPCTPHVARQTWLERVEGSGDRVSELVAFGSI